MYVKGSIPGESRVPVGYWLERQHQIYIHEKNGRAIARGRSRAYTAEAATTKTRRAQRELQAALALQQEPPDQRKG